MKYTVTIFVIVIIGLILHNYSDRKEWSKERSLYILNDSLLQKKILHIRDSSNRELTVYSAQTINTNQLLTSKSKEADQLRADLKRVKGNIEHVTSSTSVASNTTDTSHIKIDSIVSIKDTGVKVIPFSYIPDSFLSMQGSTAIHIGSDSIEVLEHTIAYSIANKSSLTFYNESKFLHKSQLKALITQDNPHTTTGKVQIYYISPEKKWFEKWYVHSAIGAISAIVLIHYLR